MLPTSKSAFCSLYIAADVRILRANKCHICLKSQRILLVLLSLVSPLYGSLSHTKFISIFQIISSALLYIQNFSLRKTVCEHSKVTNCAAAEKKAKEKKVKKYERNSFDFLSMLYTSACRFPFNYAIKFRFGVYNFMLEIISMCSLKCTLNTKRTHSRRPVVSRLTCHSVDGQKRTRRQIGHGFE